MMGILARNFHNIPEKHPQQLKRSNSCNLPSNETANEYTVSFVRSRIDVNTYQDQVDGITQSLNE